MLSQMCPDSLGTGLLSLDGPFEKGAGMAGSWLALIPIECGRRSAPEQERHTLQPEPMEETLTLYPRIRDPTQPKAGAELF